MSDQRGPDLWPMFRLFWRGRFVLALSAFLGVLAFGFHAFYVATPQYQATSVVILETRREEIVDLQAVVTGLSGKATEINTEMEVLRGRVLMGRVADDLGLLTDPEFNTALVPDSLRTRLKHALRRMLLGPDPREVSRDNPDWERESVINAVLDHTNVQAVPASYVFRITARSSDPAKAALIADAVATHYMQSQIEVKEAATADATRALSDRVDNLQSDLATAEARIGVFINSRDATDPEREVIETRAAIVATQASLDRIRARQTALATAPDTDAQARAAGDDTLRALSAGLGIPAGQDAFDARLAEVVGIIDAEIAETEGELADLDTALADLTLRAADAMAARRDLDRLQRDADANRILYEDFLMRLKETEAQQGMVQADSRILSHAIIPNYHFAPRRSQMVAMGLIFGLVAGAALILLREVLVTTFRSAGDLASRTGHQVLGQIPVIPATDRAGVLRHLRDRPQSVAAEAVRSLRTSLAAGSHAQLPRIILSASSLPDEGKTTLAVALAQNLAAMGKSVVLVDGDLRRSAFEEYFGPGTGKGLMAVLAEDTPLEEALFAAEPYGFDVLIGASAGVPGVPDILSSDGFADLMALLAETYDVVVVDSPPVLIVPDARIIGRLADMILFSVRWNHTTHGQAEQGLQQFAGVGATPPGLVLTQVVGTMAPASETIDITRRGAAYFQS